MVRPIRTSVQHMVTGPDGETVDPARVLWIAAFIVFLGGACSLIYRDKFNMQEYGTGVALLLAGGAGAVKIKESSEPKVTQ